MRDQAWLLDRVTVTGDCWLWNGYCDDDGYGRYSTGVDGDVLAHRIAYRIFIGPIPDGLEIDHTCRVRRCANPLHLEAIEHGENVRRGISGLVNGARQRAKTACPKGHSYSGANLYICPRGKRECRTCKREAKSRSDLRRVSRNG
jgi:hypothetical protein